MLEAEAVRLRDILLGQGGVSPLLNLGSSTAVFRTVTQPHIERRLFGPLAQAGLDVVHADLKQGEGVDFSGDILDPEIRAALERRGFKAVLVANLLEHVRDPRAVAAAIEQVVKPSGLILVTVPSSYPYHADPIDTGLRPSPAALAGLFAGSEPVLLEELEGPSYAEEMHARGTGPWRAFALTLAALALARPRSFAARVHRWRWYRRPYRISIALLRVKET